MERVNLRRMSDDETAEDEAPAQTVDDAAATLTLVKPAES
jgi:hypothetical protein